MTASTLSPMPLRVFQEGTKCNTKLPKFVMACLISASPSYRFRTSLFKDTRCKMHHYGRKPELYQGVTPLCLQPLG